MVGKREKITGTKMRRRAYAGEIRLLGVLLFGADFRQSSAVIEAVEVLSLFDHGPGAGLVDDGRRQKLRAGLGVVEVAQIHRARHGNIGALK